MMYNDALFTKLGVMSGLSFWRQLISLISYIILLKLLPVARTEGYNYTLDVLGSYKKLFVYIGFASLLTIMINGFGIYRVFYAITEYAFPIPFIFVPMIAVKCGWSRSKLNRFFIGIGIFLSTGLIVDYITGGFFTTMFILSISDALENFDSGRFYFLSTSNAIFTVYYSLCVMCCFHEYHNSNRTSVRVFLLLISFYCIFASIFCGARQTLVGLLLVEFLGLFSIVRSNATNVLFLLVSFGFLYLAVPSAQKMLSDNTGFGDRYSAAAIQEDERNETWQKGFEHCFSNTTVKRALVGDGVSYVVSMKAAKGEEVGKHYENTFFTRISELGIIVGIISLLIPIYYFWKYKKRSKHWLLYLGVICSYFFICMISPNGGSAQTQMSMLMLLGMYFQDIGLENCK